MGGKVFLTIHELIIFCFNFILRFMKSCKRNKQLQGKGAQKKGG
jgi:hypothetical protein